MKSKSSIKPLFVALRRRQDNYVAAVSADSLKRVVVFKNGKSIVDVHTSNHDVTLEITSGQASSLERELTRRYNLVKVGRSIQVSTTAKAYNAILVLDTDDSTQYIWPRGLSLLRVENAQLHVNLYGEDDAVVHQLAAPPNTSDVLRAFEVLHIV